MTPASHLTESAPHGSPGEAPAARPRVGLAVAAAGTAAGLLWAHQLVAHGLRISGDSAVFLDAASHLRFDGQWTAPPTRPPLYPSLIALLMTLQPHAADAAALLGALVAVATLGAAAALGWRLTRDGLLTGGLVAALALWPSAMAVWSVAWTDGLAGALAVGHLLALERAVRGGRRGALALAGLLVGLGALTRFLGLVPVAVFAACLLGAALRGGGRRGGAGEHRAPGAGERALALIFAVGPPGAWLAWSRVARGSATGERRPADVLWTDQALALVDQLGVAVGEVPWLAAAGALLAGGAAVAARRGRSGAAERGLLAYVLLLVGAQLVAIVAATSGVAVDPIGPRYLAPVLPLALMALPLGWAAARPAWQGAPRAARAGARVALVAGVALSALRLSGPAADHLGEATGRQGRSASATVAGFSGSAPGLWLRARMGQILREEADAHLIVIAPERGGLQWMAALWRGATFAGSGLRLLRVDAPGPGPERRLRFAAPGGEAPARQLTASPAPPGPDAAVHAQRLQRRLRETPGRAWIFAHKQGLPKGPPGPALAALLGDGWRVESVEAESAYVLARVARADAGEAAAAAAVTDGGDAGAPAGASGAPSPFSRPGRRGIGEGWAPTQPRFLEVIRRVDGQLQINGLGDETVMACGPLVPVDGEARVRGRIRSAALPEGGFAELRLLLKNADGEVIRAATPGGGPRRVARIEGTTDWREVDERLRVPGARQARVCVWARGEGGSTWVDALAVEPVGAVAAAR